MSLQASVKFNIQIDSLGFLLKKKKESLEKKSTHSFKWEKT